MKKATWIIAISGIVLVLAWGILGFKVYRGNADIFWEAAIGFVALIVLVATVLYRKAASAKCPYCGEVLVQKSKTCPHCGRELKNKN